MVSPAFLSVFRKRVIMLPESRRVPTGGYSSLILKAGEMGVHGGVDHAAC